MKYKFIFAIFLFVFSFFAQAEGRWLSGSPPNKAQLELASKYIKASRSGDLEALKELYFPPSLLCEDKSIPLNDALKMRIAKDIFDDYQVSIKDYEIQTSSSLLEETLGIEPIVAYSVQPTHVLKIGFKVYDGGVSIKYFRLIEKNERWYFVLDCPGPGYPEFLELKEKHEKSSDNT